MLRNKTKKVVIKYLSPLNSQKAKLARRYMQREDWRRLRTIRLVAKQTKMAERVTLVNKHI